MKLRDWIRQRGISVPDLAIAIGESDSLVRKWVYGQRQPSLPKAVAIEKFTEGEVTSRDLLIELQDTGRPERKVA